MTQMQTEQLTQEEYTNYLAFGEPKRTDYEDMLKNEHLHLYDLDASDNLASTNDWISTLDSTTFPGMTFGYNVAPCMSTAV